jgi:hypothetical protein
MLKKGTIVHLTLFLLGLGSGLVSCNNEKIEETNYLTEKKTFSQKLEIFLNSGDHLAFELNDKEKEFLHAFYAARNNKSVWHASHDSLSTTAHELMKIMEVPEAFGIPAIRIKKVTKKDTLSFIQELKLTLQLAQLKGDIRHGFLDTSHTKLGNEHLENYDPDTISNYLKNKNLHTYIFSWGIADTNYQKLATGLFAFSKEFPCNKTRFEIPSFKKDSVSCLQQSMASLRSNGFLSDSSNFEIALKNFQRKNGLHPDGKIGDQTRQALEMSNYDRMLRTCIAMEKWRWKKPFPAHHIYVNIPEFLLRYYHNDTLKSFHNIVVGTYENQTPEFCSRVHTVVSYPYWNVPYSISSKEILPALQRNKNYLTRNKMKIFRKKEEVNPEGINWSKIKENSFPYSVRQEPGIHNSLGIVKFEFHNKYGVYVHDTPSKSLFKTTVRSYSHGCVRCENPTDLAKLVLLNDENVMIPDSLDSVMTRQQHLPIHLKKYVPICFDYITVVPNQKGELIFLRDIYKRDEKLLKLLL